MNTANMKRQAADRIDWTLSGTSDAVNGLKCEAENVRGKIRYSFWMRESYRIPAKVVDSLNWKAGA